MDDLANALANYCNVVPHGIVVFLPSYAFLDSATKRWRESGALNRMGNRKKVRAVRLLKDFVCARRGGDADGRHHPCHAATHNRSSLSLRAERTWNGCWKSIGRGSMPPNRLHTA